MVKILQCLKSPQIFKTCWIPCKKPHLSTWSRSSYTFFWITPYQMRYGELSAYQSLDCLSTGILSCSWCYFVQIQLISQKFNSCATDGYTDRLTDGQTNGWMDGRKDQRTDTPFYRDARTHLRSPFSLILTCVMDLRIDRRMDGPTDGPTDGHALL